MPGKIPAPQIPANSHRVGGGEPLKLAGFMSRKSPNIAGVHRDREIGVHIPGSAGIIGPRGDPYLPWHIIGKSRCGGHSALQADKRIRPAYPVVVAHSIFIYIREPLKTIDKRVKV
jgi:hypothetical protein